MTEQERREYIKRLKELELKRMEEATRKVPDWIERGKSLIFPERYEEWEKRVISAPTELGNGLQVEEGLKIMTAIENDTNMDEIARVFAKNPSFDLGYVGWDVVFKFSKKGPEFMEAMYDYLNLPIEREFQQIIDSKKGENAILEANELRISEAKEKVPDWIERGKSLIFPERYEEWEKRVISAPTELGNGLQVEEGLKIMTAIENDTNMDEIARVFAKSPSFDLGYVGWDVVFKFSKKGPEFMEAMYDYLNLPIEREFQQIIDSKKGENAILEANELRISEAKEKVPDWVEKGESLIFPERYEEWEKLVVSAPTEFGNGLQVEEGLKIMTAIEGGISMDEIARVFAKSPSFDLGLVGWDVVFKFSKKGPEFMEAMYDYYNCPMQPGYKQLLEAKKGENAILAQTNKNKTGESKI